MTKINYLLILITTILLSCKEKAIISNTQENTSELTIYIDPVNGNDANRGRSEDQAKKSLSSIASLNIKPGTKILLSSEGVHYGKLVLSGISGNADSLITISSYGGGKAKINAYDNSSGVHLNNCSYISVNNLSITADGAQKCPLDKVYMRCAVLVDFSIEHRYSTIYLNDLEVKNVFYFNDGFERDDDEVATANGTQSYGWGIRVISNKIPEGSVTDIKILNCDIQNVAHTGVKFTGKNRNITNVEVNGCRLNKIGGPGMQFSNIKNSHISNNTVTNSGSDDDGRKWGRGSGLWTWACEKVLIEKNSFIGANGPADSAGAHIDFNCNDIIMQYNFSKDNAGGFCEILGNNYNCCYRYNVSVNDGWRVKVQNGAFQEGKTLWLSGYSGSNNARKGPYNSYIYNNTIFCKSDIESKFAIENVAKGVLIANNIFAINGDITRVKGDQYVPETGDDVANYDPLVFSNNLFVTKDKWPESMHIINENEIIGYPNFISLEGDANGFIPQNISIIKDKGIDIQKLPGDELGLYLGMDVEHDILGNPITSKPDLGAIEITN